MTITLATAINTLMVGKALSWEASGGFKSGSVDLAGPGQRRLFKFLVNSKQDSVIDAAESLFEGITAAWTDNEWDPADDTAEQGGNAATGPWRLKTIQANGFGGLNTPDGPAFELDVGCENWAIEGYNGSGKTSLASLILWTLTGHRIHEQDGPIKEDGRREPVTDGNKTIGTWLPLATYPKTPADLAKTASITATLTFEGPIGEIATARRSIQSPVDGTPVIDVHIDPRLLASPELIETGLLMPARIGHIGFGAKSQTLYDALKMLTGLDQLAAIASGASAFGHSGRRFLKYAKDHGLDGYERDFTGCISRVRELAKTTSIDLADNIGLRTENLIETLTSIEADASTQVAETLSVLSSEISPEVDLTDRSDRERLVSGVGTIRHLLNEGTKTIPIFKAWAALKSANDTDFVNATEALANAEDALANALKWHAKQQADQRLRLKALAARFFVPEDTLLADAYCPLCEAKLSSAQQLALAAELSELKEHAEHAERKIGDACREIEGELTALIPSDLASNARALLEAEPRHCFTNAIMERFCTDEPFSNVLTGIGQFASEYVKHIETTLPPFQHALKQYASCDITAVQNVRQKMSEIDHLIALVNWWPKHREAFISAWKNFIGEKNDADEWPCDSLAGKLHALECAIENSGPLDQIAKEISSAISAAKSWNKINSVQEIRRNIAEALAPLKDLQHLVDCETHRTIVTLKGRVASILDDIRLRDRLTFQNTAMKRKAVTVEGSFSEGMLVDASLVANSSWLRALLWAFIFALREQTITDLGTNMFPLMVLDDPQTTFDPKNKRKWASVIVGWANAATDDPIGIQLFLTTHERQFYNIICETNELRGQEGKIAGPTEATKVAHIVNGTFLDRQYEKAAKDRDDEEGYKYVQQVRIYCEDLLKIMLRPESFEIGGDTLGKLCEQITNLHNSGIAPYDRSVFLKLANLLNEKINQTFKIINYSHHTFDGTIGFTEAEDVKKYWDGKLQMAFVNAFRLAADYDAFGSPSRLFAWEDNVAQFPDGHTGNIKQLTILPSGVAAAAKSDGMTVGDGYIAFEEWDRVDPIKLFKHSAYFLNAGTLDPVAGIGDVILVQDFGEPRSRNLTVTAIGNKLYARRLNESEDHSDVVILTAQATDPYALPDPVIALRDKIKPRKIVGTLFTSSLTPPPANDGNEVAAIENFANIQARLKGVKLFQVKGRSMEPMALDGQYVMTRDIDMNAGTLKELNGELVIAVDDQESVYFKRLRLHGKLVVLESANSNTTTSSEILALDSDMDYPQLSAVKAVVGVLFDLPPSHSH